MPLNRRTFLGGSAIAALTTACGGERVQARVAQGPAVNERTLDDVVARALDTARKGGATYADVIAVGDDVNDVEMVRRARIGVAMDNAVDEVKAIADWITPTSDEDGVACVIERLLDESA